jgi:hypothetical protein
MILGTRTLLPVFFMQFDGALPDVRTLVQTLSLIPSVAKDEFPLVLDKGFYSLNNMKFLLSHGCGFLIGAPFASGCVKKLVDGNRSAFDQHGIRIEMENAAMHGISCLYDWDGEHVLSARIISSKQAGFDIAGRLESKLTDLMAMAHQRSDDEEWVKNNGKHPYNSKQHSDNIHQAGSC